MDTKFFWIVPFLLIGLIVFLRRFKGINNEISNELLALIFTSLTIAIVISVLRLIAKLDD